MSWGVLDTIILFGGVQALSLCLYLLFRKTDNKGAHLSFLVFLLCVSIHNLGYASIFMGFEIGPFNMGNQPVPYKYLIAPALFGYVLYSLRSESLPKAFWICMLPALAYGILRSYWFYLIMSGTNPMIIKEVYDAGFFTVNEVLVRCFNLMLGVLMLYKTNQYFAQTTISFGTKKNWSWLKRLSRVFISMSIIHLLLLVMSLLVVGEHSRIFYYPTLIISSLFVYWIGFIGYARSNLLFFKPLVKAKTAHLADPKVSTAVKKAMEEDKLYKNPKLTSQQLAIHLDLQPKELTHYVNEQLGCNFSQFLNKYRTEEAIRIMSSERAEKYKLEALAQEAGFNSKSSFYKIFKEQTGQTPSAYLKALGQ